MFREVERKQGNGSRIDGIWLKRNEGREPGEGKGGDEPSMKSGRRTKNPPSRA